MVIKFEEALDVTKKLYVELSEITDDLVPDIFKNRLEFLVIMPKIAEGDVHYPGNIYIDVDSYYEFTISYGFTHVHITYDDDPTEDINTCVNFVKNLIEHKKIAYHLKSSHGADSMGFYDIGDDIDDIGSHFEMLDLYMYCKKKHGMDFEPEIDDLIAVIEELPYKEEAKVRYILYGQELVSKKFFE